MKLQNINKESLYFTSDHHFFHSNIIKFCNRPWGDIKIHDGALIQNWNKVVPKDGVVIHAGDFVFTGNIDWIKNLVSQLNGSIHLVLGNHDYQNKLDREVFKGIFASVSDMINLIVKDEEESSKHMNFIISHYPMMYWRRGYHHLHGHVHSGQRTNPSERVPQHPMRYDIGIDNNDYKPISYFELKEKLNKLKQEEYG